jgi:hypothetical protein
LQNWRIEVNIDGDAGWRGMQKKRDRTFLLEAAGEVWESSHDAAKKLWWVCA